MTALTDTATARIVPRHVAIVMDGNGRWAKARHLPRPAGHWQGLNATRRVVRLCHERGVEVLTLFAFSSENWRRPTWEVGILMELFVTALKRELTELVNRGVRLRFIGDRAAFSERLQRQIAEAEALTEANTRMQLVIAASYGGRWDIVQAAQRIAEAAKAGQIDPAAVDGACFEQYLSTAGLPDPDLLIRTGGEKRISNFLLWQLAYTEFFFSDSFWPDFDAAELDSAFESYAARQRRFGRTGDQVASRA
ncbi:MAG: polyprenyl diphosphate synthase [Chromatiales bacterium]|jgi:undecaprenyl diphosphate synthase|nr:polyprenyl diphosphate synthase [Chromatiales bacterium]MDX9766148.1 polyprenyl diphosphate synthase [Ectothiorhodospiraceae bacterium]